MTFRTDLYTRLSTHSGLIALISTRSYPYVLPQNITYPALTYNIISSTTEHAFGSDPGNEMRRVQVSIWDTTALSVENVGIQVKAALSRWSGAQANVTIEDSFLDNELDDYDPETKDFRTDLDFIIHYR